MDYDILPSDNLSLSTNPLNHSSDGIFFVGNHLIESVVPIEIVNVIVSAVRLFAPSHPKL
jgi:hypothetical protein